MRRLRAAAEFAIYTPGSSAGTPVNILGSFAAPPDAMREDEDVAQALGINLIRVKLLAYGLGAGLFFVGYFF